MLKIKKLVSALLFATAIGFIRMDQPDENGTVHNIVCDVLYQGADAPVINTMGLTINIDNMTSAQVMNAVAAAIRADAVSKGFVIQSSQVKLPGLTNN